MWQDQILVVIPSINGAHLLSRMLPTMRFKPSNIVILDQGSSDDTAEVCSAAGVELIQLGQPHTYTQACNIGARLSSERGCKYLCVANNDVAFRTDVLGELWREMERDPKLGIVAPSQIIIGPDHETPCYRVFWDLSTGTFAHDLRATDPATLRLESDFCELTLALIRMRAIAEIGFLDDNYGFYHEDADFGFRLRTSGFGCAYLPKSQIEHFSSSTFNSGQLARKAAFITKNRIYFAQKHLGYAVHYESDRTILTSDSKVLGRTLRPYLLHYGMIGKDAPNLAVDHFGHEASAYLYTTSEAGVPERWRKYRERHAAIFAASNRLPALLSELGVANCFYVPFGIEPDIFNPWSGGSRIYDELTYLAVADGWHTSFLKPLLEAWHRFGKQTRLILLGHGLRGCLGRPADKIYRSGSVDIARYLAERIDVYETLGPLSEEYLAKLYRSVDYMILDRSGKAWNLHALGSMACGIPSIFGGTLSPPEKKLGTEDCLLASLERSSTISARDRAVLADEAAYQVLGLNTLRHTTMGLYRALTHLQQQNSEETVAALKRAMPAIAKAIMQQSDPTSDLPRLTRSASGFAARRVMTAGRLTTQFGSVWQEKGVTAAGKSVLDEMRYMRVRRLRQISDLKSGGLERARNILAAMETPKPNSVLLIGYVEAQLGLGQSLRGLAAAMSRSDVRFRIYPFSAGVEDRRIGAYMPERYDVVHPHALNVIEVTADELPTVFSRIGRYHFNRSYNVLRTYWELGKAPEAWRDRLNLIHEIWAPTEFVAASFRAIFDGPIRVVPPCVEFLMPEPERIRSFGFDPHNFHFLFSFDYFSFPQRKNPLAVLRAFLTAFPDPSLPVRLIIKSVGSAQHHAEVGEELLAAARLDDRIEIINESLPRTDMIALLAAADCYVSLHRSEGFGLGMVEAMVLGKPVIGTDYSGNRDFLSEDTGYPIPYTLKKVGPKDYVYPENQVWAEPDEDASAAAMRRVFFNREEAVARAEAGQRFVLARYGTSNVGNIVEQRLSEIFRARS